MLNEEIKKVKDDFLKWIGKSENIYLSFIIGECKKAYLKNKFSDDAVCVLVRWIIDKATGENNFIDIILNSAISLERFITKYIFEEGE